MSAYIIHIGLDLKEAFNYRRSLNADSVRALGEYAKATYGEHADLRHMTPDEESEFAGMNEEWGKWFTDMPPARQGTKLPIRPNGMKISIAIIAEA